MVSKSRLTTRNQVNKVAKEMRKTIEAGKPISVIWGESDKVTGAPGLDDIIQLSRIADVLERFVGDPNAEKPEMSKADAYRKLFTAMEEKAYIAMFQEELSNTITKVKGGTVKLEDAVASIDVYREMLVGKIVAEEEEDVKETDI